MSTGFLRRVRPIVSVSLMILAAGGCGTLTGATVGGAAGGHRGGDALKCRKKRRDRGRRWRHRWSALRYIRLLQKL
jgi:hypothetical protein